jgi:hypothetical protein
MMARHPEVKEKEIIEGIKGVRVILKNKRGQRIKGVRVILNELSSYLLIKRGWLLWNARHGLDTVNNPNGCF